MHAGEDNGGDQTEKIGVWAKVSDKRYEWK